MLSSHRLFRLACLTIFFAGPFTQTSFAQQYPSKPVTFVISFAAGGVADVVARLVAQKLSEKGTGTFVVENRGGAGGNIATRAVLAAPADGYTVLATTTALAVNATASRNRGYQFSDLRAVAITAPAPDVMAVHPSSPHKSMKDLIASYGDKVLSYGTSGFGTGPYIGAAYFFQEIAKIKTAHVPFTGGGPAVVAAIGNHVPVIVVGLPTAQSQIEQGILRGLAIPAPVRNAALPNIPTYAEAGYPGVNSATWVGFFVATPTPDAVVTKLNAGINEVLKMPDAQQKLKSSGFDPITLTVAEAQAYARAEVDIWEKMSKAIGFSME